LIDYLADALAWAMTEDTVLLLDYQSPWTRYDPGERLKSVTVRGSPAVSECVLQLVYVHPQDAVLCQQYFVSNHTLYLCFESCTISHHVLSLDSQHHVG
jgi:hypothetical protein